ncbi:RNA-binding protein 39-like isoform X2 [Hylaeus volcanicus]|uniref:RNA-binding protein 39-like isoform X2 n=1 Tax=Hylaeus volcanicus TaxID=313075 RepID=UPI0023B7EA82|nr:RNA-binding protein 39-like isoform X2 [Hylaeus volcanicus]
MNDVDFDQLEAVLDSQTSVDQSKTKASSDVYDDCKSTEKSHHSKETKRSRSLHRRDASNHRKSCSRTRSRTHSIRASRSRSHYRSRHNTRRRSNGRSYHRTRSSRYSSRHISESPKSRRARLEERRLEVLRETEEERQKQDEARRAKEEEDKKRREFDEARRDDLTVLILNLSLKATERDVWKFFSERAGKVRDIQIIRDSRSGKSKGVGYVEFYSPQAVLQALALSGSFIMDIPIIVQASQAEKNRAAKAAKQQAAEITEGGPMKLYVGGLTESLCCITESDLQQLFSPFGDIVHVELPKDPYTGDCKGYGFIQFRQSQDAREAMAAMNGFDIGGKKIKVGYATDVTQRGGLSGLGENGLSLQNNLSTAQNALQAALMYAEQQADNERLDDEGGGLLSGVNPRISLMQKLQRLDTPKPDNNTNANTFSANVCLEGLFTETDVKSEGPTFLDEIVEDVRTECSKYGVVLQLWLNRNNVDGKVWVKFGGPDQAVKAHQALNGRFFAGNKITVSFIQDTVWATICV